MKVTSKLDNALLLRQHSRTSRHIPDTKLLTQIHLQTMLDTFPFVYLKPNDSAQGKGILRIDRHEEEYTLRSRDTNDVSQHDTFTDLWKKIHHLKRKRMYLIQQGIQSITTNERPFDIRVHLARIQGNWIIAGIVARLANKESIVTNAYSGGISKHVHTLLEKDLGLPPTQSAEVIQQLTSLSLVATQITSKMYPKWAEFGLDIGLDTNMHPWIYEINITPGGKVFKNLDHQTYLHILRLHRQAR